MDLLEGGIEFYEYMNLSDVSYAERDIIYKILYKYPNATLAQNDLFANLRPNPGEAIPTVPIFNFDKHQPSQTQPVSVTEANLISGEHGTGNIITHNVVTSFGVISTSVPGQNGHPVPTQQQQGSVLMMDHQNIGPPQQLRGVYPGGQMVHVPPNIVYQQIAHQQQFGPNFLAHLNQHQHPHMNQQYQIGLPHVTFASHMHPQGQQGFTSEELSHMQQKSHDTHPTNSSSSGQSGKGYRKGQRPRRADEPPTQINQFNSLPYYPGLPYGVYFNPGLAATVSNVTGQPIILPASAQQPQGAIYQQYQPHMYPGGGELEQTARLMQPSPVPQIQSEVDPPPHIGFPLTMTESSKPIQEFVPNSGPSCMMSNGPTHEGSSSPVSIPEMTETVKAEEPPVSSPVTTPDSPSKLTLFHHQSTTPTTTEPNAQKSMSTHVTPVPSPPETKSSSNRDNSSNVVENVIVPPQLPPPASSPPQIVKPIPKEALKSNPINFSKVDHRNSNAAVVNGPPPSFQKTEEPSNPHPHRQHNGPPPKREKDNLDFPQLPISSSGGGSVSVTNGPKNNSAPPPTGRSWASVASLANGPPTNGVIESLTSGKSLLSDSGFVPLSNSEVPSASSTLMERHSLPYYGETHFDPSCLSNENDPIALNLGEFLAKYQLNHHSLSLTPRGLVNQSNFCYINATLQSLLACPPFVNLFRSMRDIIGKKPCKATPILQSVFDFVMDFEPITRFNQNNKNKRPTDAFYVGPHLEPTGIRRVLSLLEGATFKVEGRQEDAEEFLSHLLNGLHDEMIKTIRWYETKKERMNSKGTQANPSVALPSPNGDAAGGPGEEKDEEWQVMGPKNKGSMTRKTDVSKSPISEMFVGQMSSLLNRGTTPKTTTLQPFFTLQLDIQDENIHSVRDALEGLSTKEEVSGIAAANGQDSPMWKQLSLEFLPIILVIHLKRFVYEKSCNRTSKLDKRIDFGVDLEIGKELLSINCRAKSYNSKQRSYKLFAAVYHEGDEAHKGHYVADTFHPSGGSLWGQFGWIRYDDTQVSGVKEGQILNPQAHRVPYLLYYRRTDTLTPGIKKPMDRN